MSKHSISNNKGMSILSVLIGASALLVVGLAISQLIQTQADMVSFMEDRLSAVNLKNEVMITLSDQDACLRSLNDGNFSKVANSAQAQAISIKDASGRDVLALTTRFDKLAIRSIQVKSQVPIAANGSGTIEFVIAPDRTRGKITKNLAPLIVRKKVKLGATLKAVECSDLSNSEEDSSNLADLVPGNVKDISGGCMVPQNVSPAVDKLQNFQDQWTKKCEGMKFPQPKASYFLYGVTGNGTKTSLRNLVESSAVVSQYMIDRLTRDENESEDHLDPQVRGPYANMYQCVNDGIIPLGTSYNLDTNYNTASGKNEGESTRKIGRCAGGSW